ncbi:MAG TPA: SPOR domain-containing protein [Kofleriaceae bacterium]|jgi:cell division protein FtsN|nr:SPOR domain-containing protein [Kofleriaceae bacterium]
MPSRDPELYKDKIEVSLDGRQIFYLFFGGAVIVGMVFVLGVLVGRRVEARGHLDRADPPAATDPLAALDRLERSDHLSFHGALTGSDAPTDVEKAIGELEKRRAASRGDAPDRAGPAKAAPARAEAAPPPPAPAPRPEARADGKPEAARTEPAPQPPADKPRPDGDKPRAESDKPHADKRDGDKREADKREADKHDGDKREADKRDGDKHDGDKHDGDKKARKHDDSASSGSKSDKKASSHESSGRSDAHADARGAASEATDPAADKLRFTLQLSSFQDKAEAEAFLSATKAAGFQPYLTEADVTGKGTFYRVRLGSYRSLEAASDAKADYEKASRKIAQVMRL